VTRPTPSTLPSLRVVLLCASCQRATANAVLMALKERPDAWTRVDTILETSSDQATKFYALSVLDDAIRFRWKSLPPEQREGIKKYLVSKIMAVRVVGVGGWDRAFPRTRSSTPAQQRNALVLDPRLPHPHTVVPRRPLPSPCPTHHHTAGLLWAAHADGVR
jgi:hypothetical protein